MDDVRSLFFATQVPNRVRRPMTQQTRVNNSSEMNVSNEPHERFRITKSEAKHAKKLYEQTLINTHKLELSVNKLEKKKQLTRAEFLKLYGNVKYKRFNEELQNESRTQRRSFQEQRQNSTKKKKLEGDLERMLNQSEAEEKISFMQKLNKKDKEVHFYQTKKFRTIRHNKISELSSLSKKQHDQIKEQKNQFQARKTNMAMALQERAKYNYFKRVNKELSILKDYKEVIDEINQLKFDDLGRIVPHEGRETLGNTDSEEWDKKYHSFFMTTKNTIS